MKLFLNFVKGIYYGVKIEEGYNYRRIKCGELLVMEYKHELLTSEGWEQHTDAKANFNYVWIWYRRKK